MKVIYTKKELGRYFRLTAMGILASMVRVPWCMVLVVVNLAAGFVRLVKMCVKRWPMRTLLFALAGMSLLTIPQAEGRLGRGLEERAHGEVCRLRGRRIE